MNVRLSRGSARFRISKDELGVLLGGKSIDMTTSFPDKKFLCQIVPDSNLKESLAIIYDEQWLRLCVSLIALKQLNVEKPPKDGICSEKRGADGELLKLSLEVDLKDSSRMKERQ
jgi:hypothetical protein